MLENLAFRAFVFGIISAVSLPLGALTSKFWKPKDRIEAFLIAFGGGALLAALTIDLVGDALERGNFYPLALGCILGGLFFVGVPDFLFALIGGMAAGAMLTMIAQTMMPEAFSKGGAISGFSTLLGFLAAIFFKTLE